MKMLKFFSYRQFKLLFIPLLCCCSSAAFAHFLTLHPEKQVIDQGDNRNLNFDIFFTHPMAGVPTMSIERPEVKVDCQGKVRDLSSKLTTIEKDGKQGWQLREKVKRPATCLYFATQQPYFDASEDVVLQQHAKVVVDAFATGDDWQLKSNAPVEIIPLTRPFALWTNNVFTGVVLVDGKPAAGVPVELEYANPEKLLVPSDAWLNQTVVTNSQGEFFLALPKAGWWGMAALVESPEPVNVDGKSYPFEQAGVLWLQTTDFPESKKLDKKGQ